MDNHSSSPHGRILGLDEDPCGLHRDDPDDRATIRTCSYWLEGVLLIGVGSVGILGNLIAILVLHLEKKTTTSSSSFNRLLAMLATFDTVFILFTLIDYSLARVFFWPWAQDSEVWVYLIPKVLYPLNNMTFCCSIYLTVMLAWERYLAVCHPNHYRMVNRSQAGYTRTLLVYVLPVVLFSIVLNIPKFLETELVYDEYEAALTANKATAPFDMENDTDLGSLLLEESYLDNIAEGKIIPTLSPPGLKPALNLRMSKLRNDSDYIAYYIFATRLLVTGLLPFGALVFFNYRIHVGLRTARLRVREWKFPRRTAGATLRHQRMRTELNLAVVLVAIVVVFLVCNLPRLLLNLLELVLLHMQEEEEEGSSCQGILFLPAWFQCLTAFSHLMLMTNASVNFVIYWSMSACFKNVLRTSLKTAMRNIVRCGVGATGNAGGCITAGRKPLCAATTASGQAVVGGGCELGLLALPTALSTSMSTRLSSVNSSGLLQPNIVVTECSD
jgi:7 transmembrane receptor (rhodopsin family)